MGLCKEMYCRDSFIKNCQIMEGSGKEKNIWQKENPYSFKRVKRTKFQLYISQLK